MRTPLVKLIFGAILLASIISLGDKSVFGQLIEIENKLPKIVPVEVEFKNYDKENWWHDLEIKVTNTGKKPIYYLWLILSLDVADEEGNLRAVSLKFGDIKRFGSTTNGEVASESDSAILPKESYTFKVGDNFVKGWDLRKKRGTFVEPSIGELEHGLTNFGDGTGIEPGGTPWRSPSKKKFEISPAPRLSTAEENIIGNSIDFFFGTRPRECAGSDEGSNLRHRGLLQPLNWKFLMPENDNCISCSASNCPAPAGYDTNPSWTIISSFQTCQNCNENPNREVQWPAPNNCFDPTAGATG